MGAGVARFIGNNVIMIIFMKWLMDVMRFVCRLCVRMVVGGRWRYNVPHIACRCVSCWRVFVRVFNFPVLCFV